MAPQITLHSDNYRAVGQGNEACVGNVMNQKRGSAGKPS